MGESNSTSYHHIGSHSLLRSPYRSPPRFASPLRPGLPAPAASVYFDNTQQQNTADPSPTLLHVTMELSATFSLGVETHPLSQAKAQDGVDGVLSLSTDKCTVTRSTSRAFILVASPSFSPDARWDPSPRRPASPHYPIFVSCLSYCCFHFPSSRYYVFFLLSPRDVLTEVEGSAPFIGPHGLLYPPSGGGVDGDGELVVVWYGVVVVVAIT